MKWLNHDKNITFGDVFKIKIIDLLNYNNINLTLDWSIHKVYIPFFFYNHLIKNSNLIWNRWISVLSDMNEWIYFGKE
jgi:hypothetical protein